MPDILIRGMEMPTKGNPLTVLVYPDGTATWKDREYEAVELPAHGDLVEADKLREIAYGRAKEYGCVAFVDAIDITLAPVIVPASEEGNHGNES